MENPAQLNLFEESRVSKLVKMVDLTIDEYCRQIDAGEVKLRPSDLKTLAETLLLLQQTQKSNSVRVTVIGTLDIFEENE